MIPTCAVSAFILFVVMPMKPDTDVLVRPPPYHPIISNCCEECYSETDFFIRSHC